MKLYRSPFLLARAIVVLGIAVTVFAKSIARPPTPSDVAGVYSGYGGEIEFLLLELDADGTGLLSVSYLPDNPVRLYRVESWRLSDWIVELQTRAIDPDAEGITFHKVRYSSLCLDGEFRGSDWKRTIKLYSERQWQSRAVPAKERIARYRKEKQP
jgi:hypothetical protein